MTDRIKGLTVLLEPNKRDDTEYIINAIRTIKGVVSVKSHITDRDHYFAVETARMELTTKLWDVLK